MGNASTSVDIQDDWVVVSDKKNSVEMSESRNDEKDGLVVNADDLISGAQTAPSSEHIEVPVRSNGFKKTHVDLERLANEHLRTKNFVKNLLWLMMLLSFMCVIMLVAVAANKHEATYGDRIHLLAIVLPLFVIANAFLWAVRKEMRVLIVVFIVVGMLIGYIVSAVGFVLSGKNQ